MKISIAMATYNGAEYIKEQLKSLVDQTRQPDELIITDDCSTDETEIIVRDFSKNAPFNVIFERNKNNLGYCQNFNIALMKTSGDIVFLSDQDDVWFPEKIEHIIGVATRNPEALLIMNDAALTDKNLNEVGLTKVGQIRSAGLSMDNFVMGCCCAIRRELLDICMPIPVAFKSHDCWLVWFAGGLKAKIVDETVLQFYRRHQTNESQFIANSTKKVTRLQAFFHSLRNILTQDTAVKIRAQLKQLKVFTDGLFNTSVKAPEKYKDQLEKLETDYRQLIYISEMRLAVIEKPFFSRIAAASSLLMRGGYSKTNWPRAFIRDILG